MLKKITPILILLFALPVWGKMLYEYGSFQERAQMAYDFGLVSSPEEYTGDYDTNIKLLKILESQEGQENTLGANPFQPSGVSVYIRQNLEAGSSRTGTTLDIDPIITVDGHRLTFSDFNSDVAFAKIDQGTSNEEIIKFTGITDNTTYYTLTGVTWGCNFYNNVCDVDANKKKHNSGARLIITNDWHFVDANYVSLGSDQTITGVKTFASTSYPRLDSYTAPTADEQFAPKKYVDDIAISGAPDATETVKGIAELATGAEAAAGTSAGSTGARLVLPASLATTTADTAGNHIVVTDTDGKLDQSLIDLSEEFNFTGTTTMATATIQTLTVSDSLIVTGTSTGAGFSHMQVYESSGTWIVPDNVQKVRVIVVGGGGNGGSKTAGQNSPAGGGGGGGYCEGIFDVSATSSISITVGDAEETSRFSSYCYATGGSGGTPGQGYGGDINLSGEEGGPACDNTTALSGKGGDSQLGRGGASIAGSTTSPHNGKAGKKYGGGGSGCIAGNDEACSGGAGAQGVVIIYY